MSDDLAAIVVRRMVINGCTLEEMESLAKLFKAAGVNKETIIAMLQASRTHAPTEAIDDIILEVLDFVGGYCPPWRRIFP